MLIFVMHVSHIHHIPHGLAGLSGEFDNVHALGSHNIYIYISVNLEAQRVEKWLSRFDVFNLHGSIDKAAQ